MELTYPKIKKHTPQIIVETPPYLLPALYPFLPMFNIRNIRIKNESDRVRL
jgi:hypothetical protein